MMTGLSVPDVKCIAHQELTTVAYASAASVAWTTIVPGRVSHLVSVTHLTLFCDKRDIHYDITMNHLG